MSGNSNKRKIKMENKILTLEEVKDEEMYFHEYEKGVYEYKTEKGYILIENNKVLCQNVKWCEWYEKGIYRYETENGYTVIENNKILIKDVRWCIWYSKGVYQYETKQGGIIKVGF